MLRHQSFDLFLGVLCSQDGVEVNNMGCVDEETKIRAILPWMKTWLAGNVSSAKCQNAAVPGIGLVYPNLRKVMTILAAW